MGDLAKEFAQAALTTHPMKRFKSTATRLERHRIERALYRLDLNAQYSVHEEQKDLFFTNFSPGENEQLGCIHDFLVRAVSMIYCKNPNS